MVKPKIEIGQCYEFKDEVYEVIEGPSTFWSKGEYWTLRNTLTKQYVNGWPKSFILKLRRPFQNFG